MASFSMPPPPTDAADTVLTSLCSVCRAVPPRYKCPRCGTRSCSVVCSRRHRVRAGCSGIRDVTAYVPRSRLCTPAGIDHDFNFLRGIELARARAEKQIVEERHLLRPRELEKPRVLESADDDDTTKNKRPFSKKKQQPQHSTLPPLVKEWHGDELRFVPARVPATGAAHALASGNSGPSKRVHLLCQRGGIRWFGMPRGMARQRENGTTVVPLPPRPGGVASGTEEATEPLTAEPGARTKKGRGTRPISDCCIAWQVEWLVYEDGPAGKPTRILRRHIDHEPLLRLYASTMGWVLQKNGVTLADTEEDRARLKAATAAATAEAASAVSTEGEEQDPDNEPPPSSPATEPGDALGGSDSSSNSSARFYLLRPRLPMMTSADAADDTRPAPPSSPRPKGPLLKELIPLEAHDTLATALRGRTVLEFPTIYVLPATEAAATAVGGEQQAQLPAGHILGSTARRAVDGDIAVNEEDDNDDDNDDDGVAGTKSKEHEHEPPAAKKQKTQCWAGIQEVDDSAAPAQAPAPQEESETSSEGETSEDESEADGEDDENDDGEDDEGLVEEEGEDSAALPPLAGLTSGSVGTKGKAPLVVYESWSEGSGDEA